MFKSLVPGRGIFDTELDILSSYCEIDLRWMPQGFTGD